MISLVTQRSTTTSCYIVISFEDSGAINQLILEVYRVSKVSYLI